MSALFTKEEAVAFLETKWGLVNVCERLQTNSERKPLLDEIATTIQVKVPFQGITFLAVPPDERRRPNVETIKQECMAGVGGLCYNLNVFAWGLLKAVGFSAHLCHATCTSTVTSPRNHVVVLITDLDRQGDIHLVECGYGFPTFRAVSLNFQEESPVFVDSFLEYKFIRHDGHILRMHGKGDHMKRNDPPVEGLDFFVGRWRRFYCFKPVPADNLYDFDFFFDRVFTVPRQTPFDTSPRALCFPDRKAVAIVNNKLNIENESGEFETTDLADDDAIVSAYKRHFPVFLEETVRKALAQWHAISD